MSDVLDEYEQLESDYGQLLAEWFLDITAIYDDAKQNIPLRMFIIRFFVIGSMRI